MSLVITVVLFGWLTSALIRSAEAKKQLKREARIRAEQKRQREELRQQREDAKEWARQQVEMQREQIRLAKEQEKQAQELAKHEAWLVKHDEEIAKLTDKVNQATEDIEFLRDKVKRLNKLAELEELERDASIPYGKEYQKHEKKLIALENQIRTANRQMEKAYSNRKNAEIKLREVA